MAKSPTAKRFDINAAVVFRLGEELITDVVQALVELVKNSYDADATWVRVRIDTRAKNDRGREYADAIGTIVVEDNGDGMDEETIKQGWLTIANSPKRQQKAKGRVTRLGRTPIGDKGLGRLGSQRLARNVEIITRSRAHPIIQHYLGFSWADFRGTSNLGEVPVQYEQRKDGRKRSGMTLILSDLVDLQSWQDKERVLALQRQLAGLISPFEEAKDFRVHLQVDGDDVELAEITRKVRETALLRYTFDFDGEALHISGRAKLKYFQPRSKAHEASFKSHCEEDKGKALYRFLSAKTGGPESLTLPRREGWFVEFGTRFVLDDIDKVKRTNKVAVDPGPFRGEVDSVGLESAEYRSDAVSGASEYRKLVRDLAGIRVYRDGFGIRVGEDWLGLGKQQTEGSSYYGLRPGNVLGFVAISARDNPNLEETTSREGFQVTLHYENFFSLLTEFVRFAGGAQAFLRRGVLSFLNEQEDREAGFKPEDPHSAVTQRMEDIAAKLSSEGKSTRARTGRRIETVEGVAEKIGAVRNELDSTLVEGAPVSSVLEGLEGEVSAVSTELQSMKEVLDRRWETMNEQVARFYESISLGLTAEALSHEIHNIAGRLADKSTTLLRQIRQGRDRRASVVAYIEEVRSSIAAMRKQLGHLTPSLRYLREQRERIDVGTFVEELAAFYAQRLEGNGIRMVVQVQSKGFSINMNKGKLTQVLDNLVLNAEYWLREALRAELISGGEIRLEVEAPFVRVADNGRGVDESVEDSLFDPFVTMKRKGEGRGLGLFVCRQLLESESCDLVLLPERNERGRRYAFEIDLSGAVGE